MESIALPSAEAAEVTDGVYLAQLAAGERMSVQHYHMEPGAGVPEHDHEHEQVGFVYEGTLTFAADGEEVTIATGESYSIPSGEPHAAVNEGDGPARGLDIFSPPRLEVPWA